MYTSHFGLTEFPFSITPDPRYLYMSERHREALAHLLYGVGDGGGFVQLTGEVGTGKTTLCRSLLEQLPPHVDVALILNPRLTAIELLATVCDELSISYPPGTASVKLLVDALYRHLLDAHARGRRTVLIIDEAQSLAAQVLEQIRLLTNLETAKEKLLQIILIGQPELTHLLNRPRLRQLAQRVTARYHLLPLSKAETRAYIRHRIEVAGRREMLLSDAAMRQVHGFSGGVPRLINVICDRALLGAYAQNRDHVDAVTARRAAKEVLGRITGSRYARVFRRISAVTVVGAAIAGTWIFLTPEQLAQLPRSERPLSQDNGVPVPSANETAPTLPVVNTRDNGRQGTEEARLGAGEQSNAVATSESDRVGVVKLADVLAEPSLRSDKTSAFVSLFSRWRLDYHRAKSGLACERARLEGLACLFKVGTWTKLRRFNLPAIIELATPTGGKHYAAVTALERQSATLEFGGRQFTLDASEIDLFWDGSFILLWKPPPLSTTLVAGMRGRDVEWLRQRLSELDGRPLPGRNPDVYDDELKERVMTFQRSRSLLPDGIVGEETLTNLTTARHDPGTPSLSSARP